MKKVLIFILLAYLFVFLHELCHAIGYHVFKVSIKKFYFFPFSYETNKGISLDIKKGFTCLGLVVPEIPKFDEEKYSFFVKGLKFSLLSPYIMHICVFTITFSAWLVFKSKTIGMISLINFFMICCEFQSSDNIDGDLLALILIKRTPSRLKKYIESFIGDETEKDIYNREFVKNYSE